MKYLIASCFIIGAFYSLYVGEYEVAVFYGLMCWLYALELEIKDLKKAVKKCQNEC